MARTYTRRLATVVGVALVFVAGGVSVLGLQYMLRTPGVTTASYGDWRLTCPPENQRAISCQLTQDLVRQGTGAALVHFEVARVGGTHRLAIMVPHGVLLDPGLGFAVGPRPQQKLVFQTCDAVGCAAFVPLEGELGDAMNKAGDGRVAMADRNGATVALQYSLRGFRDGLKTLDREAFRRSLSIGSFGL